MNEITLTFPCPICEPRVMLTARYEPGEHPADRAEAFAIKGCQHAVLYQRELDSGIGENSLPYVFAKAVLDAGEDWARDRYTDALEQRLSRSRYEREVQIPEGEED